MNWTIALTLLGLAIVIICLAWLLVIFVFFQRETRHLPKSTLDEPIDFWMNCPKCPDSNFNVHEDDHLLIVECASCNTSYIVDANNRKLIER